MIVNIILKTMLIAIINIIMIIIVIKFNNKLKRNIQSQNGFWAAQTTAKNCKKTQGKKRNNNNKNLKAMVNIIPIMDDYLRNGQMGDTNPQCSIPC